MRPDQCSDEFREAFDSGMAGCLRTCACGRTYFDSIQQWDWEEGELEQLIRKAEEDPDKYCAVDHAVGTLNIAGGVVIGCRCDLASKYEAWLTEAAEEIAQYLNSKADLYREKADKIQVNQ